MFDFFANSIDGSIVLSYIIALVLFFLYGPQKVYESLFWALLGIGVYFFLYSITYGSPELTRTMYMWDFIVEKRDYLLWCTNVLTIFLYFFAPISMGIHAGGVVRGSLWFLFKIVVLSWFFVLFGVVLLSAVSGKFIFMNQSPLYSQALLQTAFFNQSNIYLWIIDRSYSILLVGFLLAFYKIIFSHWVTRIIFILGALYVQWDALFGKKIFDSTDSSDPWDPFSSDEEGVGGDRHNGH